MLSDETLTQLADKSTTCTNYAYCIKFFDGVLDYKNKIIRKNSRSYLACRYCNHKQLKILVCGGYDYNLRTVSDIKCVDVNSNINVTVVPLVISPQFRSKVVCVKDELNIFGGQDCDNILEISVDKYSLTSNKWCEVGRLYDDREVFSMFSFINKILIIGGNNGTDYR